MRPAVNARDLGGLHNASRDPKAKGPLKRASFMQPYQRAFLLAHHPPTLIPFLPAPAGNVVNRVRDQRPGPLSALHFKKGARHLAETSCQTVSEILGEKPAVATKQMRFPCFLISETSDTRFWISREFALWM